MRPFRLAIKLLRGCHGKHGTANLTDFLVTNMIGVARLVALFLGFALGFKHPLAPAVGAVKRHACHRYTAILARASRAVILRFEHTLMDEAGPAAIYRRAARTARR